ncbi:MAG TPA: DUF948 domain-containing protein [Gaiellaceae bacterium]|nr:DUF948 domain-containing protein [Gaiellaceae bacterium]
MLASFGWSDFAYLALGVFLLLAGSAFAYFALRLGGTLGSASSLLEGAERELLPVISKLGGTVDRVNDQLDKVDQITDSAVDAVSSLDTAVRTVTGVVTRPIEKLAGAVTGARHAASSFRARRDVGSAVRTGQDEARRREQDLEDELRDA